jgi:serine/threonine protein kinase
VGSLTLAPRSRNLVRWTDEDGVANQRSIGRYRLGEMIELSGLTTTYRGIDVASLELVAIHLQPAPPEPDMLYREFSVGSRLSHRGLVRYRDTIRFPEHAGIVTDFFRRQPLAPGGPIEFTRRAFGELCDVLDYLHSQALVHTHLGTQCLLVQPSGEIKLGDLSYCLTLDTLRKDQWCGLAAYLAPENIGGQWETESNYFQVGVLLYECLTGEHAFKTTPKELTARANGSVVFPSLRHGRIPSDIAGAIQLLVEPDLAPRRKGWRELKHALRPERAASEGSTV